MRNWISRTLVGAAGLLTVALTVACGANPPATPLASDNEMLAVCVDPHTGFRVPEADCGTALGPSGLALDTSGYYWDYYPSSYYGNLPAFGTRVLVVPGMSRTVTRTVIVSRTVPRAGGSASYLRTSLASSARSATGARLNVSTAGSGPKNNAPANKATGTNSVQRGGFGVPNAAKPNSGSSYTAPKYSSGGTKIGNSGSVGTYHH